MRKYMNGSSSVLHGFADANMSGNIHKDLFFDQKKKCFRQQESQTCSASQCPPTFLSCPSLVAIEIETTASEIQDS